MINNYLPDEIKETSRFSYSAVSSSTFFLCAEAKIAPTCVYDYRIIAAVCIYLKHSFLKHAVSVEIREQLSPLFARANVPDRINESVNHYALSRLSNYFRLGLIHTTAAGRRAN